MVKIIVLSVMLTSALLTSCAAPQNGESIEVDAGSGVTFHTNAHTLIARNLSTKAVPYFDPAYGNNKRTADAFFQKKESWESIQKVSTAFLEKYPRAYERISSDDFSVAIAGVLYDELFRRDFADDVEEETLRRGNIDDGFFSNTLGIAQISPSIHRVTINTALGKELSLEDAATALLNAESSVATVPYILYDNHPSNLALAITRYHAGTVRNIDERAEGILSDALQNHLKSLRDQ